VNFITVKAVPKAMNAEEIEQAAIEKLRKVFHTLKHRGLTLNKAKCIFRMNRIEFMRHLLSERGIGLTE